jgi:hypothetical protein
MKAARLAPIVLAVVLAACGGGEEKAKAPTASPTASPSAVVSLTPSPTETSSPKAVASSPEATAVSSPTASPTAAASGKHPYVPRPPGTYHYATQGKRVVSGAINRTQQMPPDTTLAIDPRSGSRQRSFRDLRDENGDGSTTDMRLIYAPEGLRLAFLRNRATVGGFSDTRTFQPSSPPLVLRTGMQPGDRLTFTLRGSGVTVHSRLDVLRRETIRVGTARISSLVIRLVNTFSGDVTGRDTSTQWLRPTDGLLLKEEDHSDVRTGFTRARTDFTVTLKRVTPS